MMSIQARAGFVYLVHVNLTARPERPLTPMTRTMQLTTASAYGFAPKATSCVALRRHDLNGQPEFGGRDA